LELELDEMIELLRLDAVSRGEGSLRDDLVVLAVRATAKGVGVVGERGLATAAPPRP
jgi:hypothetical protein